MFEFNIQLFAENIYGTSGNDSILNYKGSNNSSLAIYAYEGNDTIHNANSGVTIYGGDGDDRITLSLYAHGNYVECGEGSDSVSLRSNSSNTINGGDGADHITLDTCDYCTINGNADNDIIYITDNVLGFAGSRHNLINSGDGDDTVNVVKGIYNTINGGLGNDYINIKKNTGGNIYKYYLGEGKDTIFGFGENDTLQIINSKYSILTSGEDLKINIGDGSILLKNAATIAVNIEDYYEIYNADSNVSIFGTSDADSISNTGDFVIINGEAGNDAIYSYGNKVYINGGEGNDKIYNDRVQNHIAYDDTINDSLTIDDLTIDGGIGDDSIYNEYGDNTSIIGGTGNDYIYNYIGNNVTIDAGAGDDSIYNYGDNVTIDGGAGNDYIDNSWNNNVTIDAGAGDDSIYNYGDNVTIDGGAGDDVISISGYAQNNLIQYASGDGNDSISGLDSNDTLKISGAEYTTTNSGSDLIIGVGSGKITVVGGANAGFTIDGTLKGGGSENETLPTGITVKNSIVTAAKTFTGKEINLADYDANKVNAAALTSGISIIGNAENNSLSGGKGADTISGGAGNDTLTGGAGKDIFVYSAGNDIITDYKSGEDIISATYTNSTVKGSDVILTTANGNLTVKGAKDKVITFDDGNELIFFSNTSYAPLATGLTYDAKRTLLTASNKFTGNEIDLANYLSTVTKVNASALSKAVSITGNANNNSLKGGKGADTISGGTGNDTLTGGSGKDIFVYSAGNDIITDYKSGEDIISATYTNSTVKGSDVILTTANGNLTVKGAKDKVITFDDGNELIFFSNTSYAPLATGLTYDAKRTLLTASNKFTDTEIDLANYLSTVTKVNASALSKAVTITGNDNANSIKGGKGADTISGGAGNDTLTGGAGKDIFVYASGNDIITDYKSGEDIISATYTNSTVKGSDVILTTANGNLTVKGAKDKVITFDDGNELIFFSNTSYAPLATGLTYDAKRTLLTASNKFTGNEIDLANYLSTVTKVNASAISKVVSITGNDNDNSIKGGKGADTISGGAGNDTLTGGSGKDIFIYSAGKDVITDYTAGDEIQIDGTISNTSYSGKNVIFTVGNGSLTVKNGKGKNISVTDSSGTQTYSKTLDILYDNNFMTDDTNLDSITEEKFSVTEIQNYNSDTFAQDENILTFAKEK